MITQNKHSRLRQKLIPPPSLQSITRKSLPSTRRTGSLAPRKSTPALSSMLLDDGETPRHILRKILQTGTSSDLSKLLPVIFFFFSHLHLSDVPEPARSPAFHTRVMAEETQPPSVDSSMFSKRPRLAVSYRNSPVRGMQIIYSLFLDHI